MPTLRRYLSLCALLFWQGGFLFYGLVVIPIGLHVLSDQVHRQARITDSATSWLNWFGLVALALLLWDVAVSPDPSRRRYKARGLSWAVLFVTLAALFGLHYWLDVLNPPQGSGPTDLTMFQVAHNLYVGVSAAQWVAGLIHLGLTVSAWRGEDGKSRDSAAAPWRAAETKMAEQKGVRGEGVVEKRKEG